MKTFTTADGASKLRYLEFAGDTPPLLMLHGLGCSSSLEYPHVACAPALHGRHVILIDLLGHGYSDRPAAFGYGVLDHAEVIRDFVEGIGLGPVDIYGHSMGGSVAIDAAGLLGDRVRRLILSEANLDSGGGEFSRPIAAASEADYVDGGHLRACEDAMAAGDEGWAATMRAASAAAVHRGASSLVAGGSPDWRAGFLTHPARKTFVFGEHSLPDPDADMLRSNGVQVLVVPNAGHSMSLENPHGLAAAIATGLFP
ncbi:alpha/beta fold hydrolase [Sphingomonas floccifaciens]|uniref:Alpha/beta fold hydrolase n=1 Tax=Sphingomonas floccifaciens TaxID=1844115 RepID=A0ABW4NGC6_9SPHN